MENEEEISNSENEADDQESETDLETTETTDEDTSDVEDVEALKEKNRQLFARAKKAELELKKSKVQPKKEEKPDKPDDIEKTVASVLEKRDLEDLDFNDEFKKEVQDYAKLKGISIKKALSSEYISFQKEKYDKDKRVEEASLGNKGRATVKKDYSNIDPNSFDFTTEEGRKEYAKYEEHLRKELG